MEYMLNELSIHPVQTKMQVYGLMENFVHAAVTAESVLNMNMLRIDESIGQNLCDIFFTKDYSIGIWLSDTKVNSDLKDKFLSITSSAPLIEEDLKEKFKDESCYHDGKTGLGIKAALLYNTCCVNFLTDECWNTDLLPVVHEFIEDDQIKTVNKTVRCFANELQVQSHSSWFLEKQQEGLSGGQTLWVDRVDFFPRLVFCESVRKNLSRLGVSTDLTNIIDRLRTLNDVAVHWIEGNFNYEDVNNTHKLTIHPESKLTLDNYSSLRRFKLPNGQRELFSLHILTGNLRIHFYPDNNSHTIFIGYIGPHLRTWLYK